MIEITFGAVNSYLQIPNMNLTVSKRLYNQELAKRRKQILALRAQNFTWTAIGKLLGITRQRAQQIGRKT